jgi:hypothetical protein
MPVPDTGNIRHHDPTVNVSSSQIFTNSKQLDLNHVFVSNKVVGPDRFRFISSYWTTPDTPNGIDTGTSAAFLAANSQNPNPKLEVDKSSVIGDVVITSRSCRRKMQK